MTRAHAATHFREHGLDIIPKTSPGVVVHTSDRDRRFATLLADFGRDRHGAIFYRVHNPGSVDGGNAIVARCERCVIGLVARELSVVQLLDNELLHPMPAVNSGGVGQYRKRDVRWPRDCRHAQLSPRKKAQPTGAANFCPNHKGTNERRELLFMQRLKQLVNFTVP